MTNQITAATVDKMKSLAREGIRTTDPTWNANLRAPGVDSLKFYRFAPGAEQRKFTGGLRVVDFRVRRGVPQFDVEMDGGHEWVTAQGRWKVTFTKVEGKKPYAKKAVRAQPEKKAKPWYCVDFYGFDASERLPDHVIKHVRGDVLALAVREIIDGKRNYAVIHRHDERGLLFSVDVRLTFTRAT